MRKTAIIFSLVVLAYVGVEVYGLHKAKDRMDPVNILDQFIKADRATGQCGQPANDDLTRFQRNLASASTRAAKALAKRNPESSADEITGMITERRQAREQEVDALIAARGCADREVWTLLRRYDIWAGLGPG